MEVHGPPMSMFLSLADELLLAIIEQIEDIETLRATALVCKRLQGLVEPYIYADVLITSGRKVARLTSTLEARPERILAIRDLTIRYKADQCFGIEHLKIRDFKGLRSLYLQTPCPNDDGPGVSSPFAGYGRTPYWFYLEHFTSLQSIHLHTHFPGQNRFDLARGECSIIFDSPTLRHIHLACANITADSVRQVLHTKVTTPLQSLVFEECNISAPELKVILSKPKALKRLVLGERLHHVTEDSTPLVEQGECLWDALSCQKNSLVYFKQTECPRLTEILYRYATGMEADYARKLRSASNIPIFSSLKDLDIPQDSALVALVRHRQPALEKLTFHHVVDIPFSRRDFFAGLTKTVEHQSLLKHVEVVLEEARTLQDDTEEQWMETLMARDSEHNPFRSDQLRGYIWLTAKVLAKRGILFTISWIRGAGYIPPYMHGEILPQQFEIYTSDRPEVFGSYAIGDGRWCFRDAGCAAMVEEELLSQVDLGDLDQWVE